MALFFNIDYDKDGEKSLMSKPDLIVAKNYIDRFSFGKNASYDFNDFSISEFRSLEKMLDLQNLVLYYRKFNFDFFK